MAPCDKHFFFWSGTISVFQYFIFNEYIDTALISFFGLVPFQYQKYLIFNKYIDSTSAHFTLSDRNRYM